MNNDSGVCEEKLAIELAKHQKELLTLKYESEKQREESLISQANNMQTALSLIASAVVAVGAILIENRGNIPLEFFLVSFGFIILPLLMSVLFASLAQRRMVLTMVGTVKCIRNTIDKEFDKLIKESSRLYHFTMTIEALAESYEMNNDKRVKWVLWSMRTFWITLVCVTLATIAGGVMLNTCGR